MDVGDKVNFDAERPAFEAWAESVHENLGGEFAGPGKSGWYYWDDLVAAAWEAWLAARRTPSASIGEDGLPELPKAAHRGPDGTGSYFDSYTADQMRQYAREAVAADRQARGDVNAPPAAPAVYTSAMGEAANRYHEGFEHAHPLPATWRWEELWNVMQSAAPTQDSGLPEILFDGYAVYNEITRKLGKTHCHSTDTVSETLDAVVRLLRAAPPLSSEPQAEKGTTV